MYAEVVHRYSVDEYIDLALKNNQQIASATEDIAVSQAKLKEAHPKAYPIIKYEDRLAPAPKNIDNMTDSYLNGEITPFNGFKFEAAVPITSFGKIATAQDLAEIGVEASWFTRAKTTADIVFKIHQIYDGILLARNLLAIAEQAQDTIAKKIEGLKKEEASDQIELLKLKLVLFEVQRKVEDAKKKESLAVSALKIQANLPADYEIDLKSSDLIMNNEKIRTLEDYVQLAHQQRPEFALLDRGVKAKEFKMNLEKKGYAPSLGFGGFFDIGRASGIEGGSNETNFSNPFNYTRGGIGLVLKGDFDFIKTSSRIEQAKHDFLKTKSDRESAMRGLDLEIEQAYLEIKGNLSLVLKADEEIKTARQIVFLTKSNMELGIGEKKDYYDALQSYLIFQGRRLEAIYNYNVALYDLKKKVGLFDFNQTAPFDSQEIHHEKTK